MDAFKDAARILLVRLGNIGDVVMLSPAVRALRRAAPRARLTLLASPAGATVAGLLSGLDEVLVHRALWQDARGDIAFDSKHEQEWVRDLAVHGFDAVFIFTSFSQSPFPAAYACYLAGIPIRIGQSREFGGGVLTRWVRPLADSAHQVDRNLHLLKEAGIPVGGPQASALRLAVPAGARARVEAKLRELGVRGDFVVIAPGATCAARRYPAWRYGVVAAGLEALDRQVVVVGGPKDQAIGEVVVAAARGTVSLCGQTDLAELAAVLQRARLLIANDSGPMHIADAVGCPMVVLYSGTELEEQWRPRTAPARILRRPTACSPCYRFECPYGLECLRIAPGEVVAQARALLGETLREVADG